LPWKLPILAGEDIERHKIIVYNSASWQKIKPLYGFPLVTVNEIKNTMGTILVDTITQ